MLLRLVGRLWRSPSFTTWGSLAVRLVGLSALLPLALAKLSTEEAALWLMFSSIIGLLTLADFGFAPNFVRLLAYARSTKKPQKEISDLPSATPSVAEADVVAAMKRIYSFVFWFALVFGATFGTVALNQSVIKIGDPRIGWLCWVIVLLSSAFNLRSGMYAAYLQGTERIAEFRRWEIFVGVATLGSSVSVLLLGGGLLGLVICAQVGALIASLVNLRLAVIKGDNGNSWRVKPEINSDVWKVLWPAAWKSGLGVLMTFAAVQGSGIVYAQVASAADVASYLLALRLMQTLVNLANVPFYTKLPTLSRLLSSGLAEQTRGLARSGMFKANFCFVLGALAVGFFSNVLLSVIGSRTSFVSDEVWWSLCAANLIHRNGAMRLQLAAVCNKVLFHIADGFSGLLSLVSIPFAYHAWGVIGLPISLSLGLGLFYFPFSLLWVRKLLQIKFGFQEFVSALVPFIAFQALTLFTLLG